MNEDDKIILLGDVEYKIEEYPKSSVQADALFTFTTDLNYILTPLKSRLVSPRYCDEDISYLKLGDLEKIAFPMKCFCDINMHRLSEHLSWYGYYGLVFTKKWGLNNNIQPIQYVNPKSQLISDYVESFKTAKSINLKDQTETEEKMKNFLLYQLMYYKPYSGKMKNRNTGEVEDKCFTEECEWRFIPDVTTINYEQLYYDENIFNAGVLLKLSNSLIDVEEVSLKFDYSDLKYIIVHTENDCDILIENIMEFEIEENEKIKLISKILVWENCRGDI